MFTIKQNSTGAILLFNGMVICQLIRVPRPAMGSGIKALVAAYIEERSEHVLIVNNADRHYVIHVTESGSVTMYSMPTP